MAPYEVQDWEDFNKIKDLSAARQRHQEVGIFNAMATAEEALALHKYKALGNVIEEVAPDLTEGAIFSMTMTGDTVVHKPLNWPEGFSEVALAISQDGEGGRKLSFAGVTWIGDGTEPTFSEVGNHIVIVELTSYDGGETVYARSESGGGGGGSFAEAHTFDDTTHVLVIGSTVPPALPSNTGFGVEALDSLTTGRYNTAVGAEALKSTTTGNRNTAVGAEAALENTTGNFNVAVGEEALFSSTEGTGNVAVGYEALSSWAATPPIAPVENVALGYKALLRSNGVGNTAIGALAGEGATTGGQSVFVGKEAGKGKGKGTNDECSVFVGFRAGANNEEEYNTYLGALTGEDSTTGTQNTYVGYEAGRHTLTSGNTFIGYEAGKNATAKSSVFIGVNAGKECGGEHSVIIGFRAGEASTGQRNVAVGSRTAMAATGEANTFVGESAGEANTTGSGNVGIGAGALEAAKSSNLVAVGTGALAHATGGENVAVGWHSMAATTTGDENAAFGNGSLSSNTTGSENTAIGCGALESNTTGHGAVAVGYDAMGLATSAQSTAVGYRALYANPTGAHCTAVGFGALRGDPEAPASLSENTAIGTYAGKKVTGERNTYIGTFAGEEAKGSRQVFLGHGAGSTNSTNGALEISAEGKVLISGNFDGGKTLGFYGVAPVARAAHPVTLGDVITLLTNLGLCS